MKHFISALVAAAVAAGSMSCFPAAVTSTAADGDSLFTHKEWTGKDGNEDVFAVNRAPASVNSVPYQDVDTAVGAVYGLDRKAAAVFFGKDVYVTSTFRHQLVYEISKFFRRTGSTFDVGFKHYSSPLSLSRSRLPMNTSISLPRALGIMENVFEIPS